MSVAGVPGRRNGLAGARSANARAPRETRRLAAVAVQRQVRRRGRVVVHAHASKTYSSRKAIRVAASVKSFSRIERVVHVVRIVIERVVRVVDDLVVPVRAAALPSMGGSSAL